MPAYGWTAAWVTTFKEGVSSTYERSITSFHLPVIRQTGSKPNQTRNRTRRNLVPRVFALLFSLLLVTSAAIAGVALLGDSVEAQVAGQVLYRVNAGGGTIAATDGGPDWVGVGADGQYVSGGTVYDSYGGTVSFDASVPSGTPTALFGSELYGDQQWTFSENVQSGEKYEVRLYFAEIFWGVANSGGEGSRVFDVSVEGQQVLDDYDIVLDVGPEVGVMKSYTVVPADGDIDVTFTTVVDNAKVSAIEIVEAEPQPDQLGGPGDVDFGTVVVGESATETVTLTNLGDSANASHPDITIDGVSVAGTDAAEFSASLSGDATLVPGESVDATVTFSPSDAQVKQATLEIAHSGTNSPLLLDLTGEGVSTVPVGFDKGTLQGFGGGGLLTALEFGPDGRLYVSSVNGMVWALNVTRNGPASYSVNNQVAIDDVQDIPNHDDNGNYVPGEDTRQVTGLTVGGTESQPVVYVSSSDPTIDVGTDDDDTDTNSGAISRLTLDWNGDTLESVDHDVMVLGLPRSEENHATNGIDLSNDGDTLYVAQGGHTNKGAPGDNFGHTPEYALSGATLEIDLAQINANFAEKNLNSYDPQGSSQSYPDLDFLYAIPTVQNDDSTDGDDLPFGGDDGLNQAKIVPGGPVQIWSPGYRNPYDLVVTEDGQIYVTDNGPNGGWGGQPADSDGDTTENAADVTNHPNEDDSYTTSDQVHLATEGHYAGHASPIRANPDEAGIYDADGNLIHDFDSSDTPVPFSMADPRQANYIPPESDAAGPDIDDPHDGSLGAGFSPLGGIVEYTASNFGGEMQGDLLVVEFMGSTSRLELNGAGDEITDRHDNFLTASNQMLGIAAQDDDEIFPGTVWTAAGGGIAVFEPNDYGDVPSQQCSGADDPSLDEDGDGYDNADEFDAGTDPCSAGSTPHDFDGDGTSDVNDLDDDNDGQPDTSDPFAVDPDDGTTTSLPVALQFQPASHPNTILDLGFTGLQTNGQDDYQDLYDPTQLTAGGAANVLTVENVPAGDAHEATNSQEYAFQVGVDAPDQPFTIHTTVSGYPETPENFQSMGLFVGNGDQDNYLKLVVAANGGTGGVEFAKEVGGSFTHPAGANVDDPAVTGPGNSTDLALTVFPGNDTVHAYYTPQGGPQQFVGSATIPASWLDSSDGSGLAVGVISTSFNAGSTFDATWTHLSVEYVNPPANSAPTADAGVDQTVEEGQQVTLDASGSSDPDGDVLGYTWTQTGGPDAGLTVFDSETVTFTAPEVDADATLTFEVTVSDGQATDADAVTVTVQDADADDGTAAGEVLYRVNAGGPAIPATDGGPDWSADTGTDPSQYTNAGESGSNAFDTTDAITLDGSVPADTPTTLFQTERWDPNATTGGAGDAPEMEWSFPVQSGNSYEVRLYFAEIFIGPNNMGPAPREFDVVLEGQTVLDDYNIFQQYGHDVGAMESFEVTPSDGSIDVEFLHEAENPKISAIEIVAVGGSTGETTVAEAVASQNAPDDQIDLQEIQLAINWWATGAEVPGTGGETISLSEIQQLINAWATGATVGDGDDEPPTAETGSALVEITPDSGNIDETTFGKGSYQITNTGEKEITAVTFDLGTASLPDVVFDPQGTAGDPTGQGFTPVSGGSATGLVSGEFSQPHNGVDADDGYDQITVTFDDFGNGETFTFWADNDPTSIKSANVGSQEAGPVSGLELARSTVTVTYEDGATQTTQLFGDGSVGGSTATVDADEASAPTIGVSNVVLEVDVLDARHSAATVADADQTITISGQPGETVTLLRVEGELTLANVPDADADGEPGYEIEAYEANDAEDVEYYTTTLDANGEASIPVTLSNTTTDGDDDAGLNYFAAVHGEPSVDAGLASNVVVLKYSQTADGGSGDGDTGQSGDVVFAVNAGGGQYTAADGTVYQADTAFSGGSTYSTSQAIDGTTDDPLYQTERYGESFSYDGPVEDGTYAVTLKFAEIYQGVAPDDAPDSSGPTDGTDENDRVFDVSIEGQTVLDDFDIYAEVGPLSAIDETFTVDVTDGELNVQFAVVNNNAKVSAIKVVEVDGSGGGGAGQGSASITVTEDSGIGASTFGGGSFEVTNTGDQGIASVTVDLSESLIPDAVFDPHGTAGDTTAKGLSVDGQSGGDGDVGVVSTADGDVFDGPHNGVNGDDGYDVLTIDFSDFEPGETVAFSVDVDPTTIKGASTTGGAGSVSGLELSGSAVTVEYADGSTQTTDLFGDGSAGGSQATANEAVPPAPTLGVDGVSLQATDFPAHEAATVDDAAQTITVSGPTGATVTLLHVEASEPPSDGYDVDAFEADNAQSVSYQTVALDGSGEATVPVSLSEPTLHYFVAAVEDGEGDTGVASNVVVLDYSESSGSGQVQVLHRVNAGGSTIAAIDGGPDWTGVTDTSSPYLVAVSGPNTGNYCDGDDVTPTSAVPESTPDAVYDCEHYGEMQWEFSVPSGTEVEVRLYLGNQFPGTSDPGDRQFNVSIEGTQVLSQYDPVADVGHANGTMKAFTVTSDGIVDIDFELGAIENPQVNAIEIIANPDGGSS